MTNFKIGDKVKIKASYLACDGRVGIITESIKHKGGCDWTVIFNDDDWMPVFNHELELAKEKEEEMWSEIKAWNHESFWPEGLNSDDEVKPFYNNLGASFPCQANSIDWVRPHHVIAYQVKKKPQTVDVSMYVDGRYWGVATVQVLDGKPDWSTLKVT